MKKILYIFLLFLVLFGSISFALTKIANDPSRISVGARPLGMGKAFVGIADDISSMFLNPAGNSNIDTWQVTSMAGKFINEINYIDLGGAYPLAKGVVSVGFIGSSIGFIGVSSTIDAVDGIRIIASTTEGVSYNYNNNAMLLSYGAKLDELSGFSLLKNISSGATLKLFSQSLAGPGVSGGTASGYDLDLGVIYKPSSAFNFGATFQNILPMSLGGKIVWSNGQEESLSANIKLGTSLKILGEKGLKRFKDQELLFALDYDFSLSHNNLPSLFHMGIEWSPIEMLEIRAGIDQDLIGKSEGIADAANNLTAGIGLLLNGYRFDYAFHQYYSAPENDTHYFSLSYGIWKKKPMPKKLIEILSPQDKEIIYQNEVKIIGNVLDKRVKHVLINDIEASIDGHTFEAYIPTGFGKNGVIAYALDERGKILDKVQIRLLKLLTFKDMPKSYWAKLVIEQMATLNLITGYPDETFKADSGITRAEFVTLLIKVKGLDLQRLTKLPFNDINVKHWAAKYIKLGTDLKLVKGYPDKTFRPHNGITRVEGVSVAARFSDLDINQPIYEMPFKDLKARHWAIKEINAAKSFGLLKFLDGKLFDPKKYLTRAETAEILSHTKFISQQIATLMDWESGYFGK